jgi:secondary thiamine-phosphate synthase enzyme
LNIIFEEFSIKTRGEGDMIDITDDISKILIKTDMKNGLLTSFIPGSTAALTTIEYEPGLKSDFPSAMDRLIPRDIPYEHDKTWHDGNGHSHVKASLIGPSLIIPFLNGRLTLGTWQQVVLLEMDTHSRSRRIVIQIMGE